MLDKIELKWLKSFEAVFFHLSFKLASEQLALPTSNVSRHVALLEQQLNVRLFERTTRKMRPTEAGQKLYDATSSLLDSLQSALQETSLQKNHVSGHLKIMTPDLPFMGEVLASFVAQNPSIALSCDTQLEAKEGIVDGFDIVMSFNRGSMADSGWVAKEIIRWPSCIVASPKLLARYPKPKSLQELSSLPCITTLSVMQGAPWRFKGDYLLTVQSSYKVNSGNMARAAAIQGLGFAILPFHACEQAIEQGQLIEIKLDREPEDLVLNAFYSGRKYPLEKVKVFLEHLKSMLIHIN
ncbi:LysR family transcriptional regulator [Pseudoalteromonas luteoviolacea]|uniref:LysR family transcriptional regulator n=1 Tax=Pseudoalteromonas luteoviolacea TaxID=43657 RepID=UPI001F1C8F1A|nr:LysR family transcriptional regulator [Pseudoalteromonas luteoviolacea]MCF6443087.1 LysR family transcriptional regulator [Pseudoalteromonas luteoviolacea]